MDDVLTKEAVAELLQCDVLTVEEKSRSGELPGIKVGRSWIFPREVLMERLNEMGRARRNRGPDSRRAQMQDRLDARDEARRKPPDITTLRRALGGAP